MRRGGCRYHGLLACRTQQCFQTASISGVGKALLLKYLFGLTRPVAAAAVKNHRCISCHAELIQTFQNRLVGDIECAGVMAIGKFLGRAHIDNERLLLERRQLLGR